MNPDLQDDIDPAETFAGRVAGLDELRRQVGPDVWRDKAIDDALRGGKYLERRFNDFRLEVLQRVSGAASSTVQADFMRRVELLEAASQRSNSLWDWILEHGWQVLMLLAAVAIGHWWK